MRFLFSVIAWVFFSYAHAACKPAQRVISLAPDITEILFAIGAGDKVIGVIQGSDYPDAAKNIPVVGSYTGVDIEKILSLKPDLIVTWGKTFSRQLAVLKKLGIPVYSSDTHNLTDIPYTMKQLGCLTDRIMSANNQVENFMYKLHELEKKYRNKKNITVFYQIGSYSLITVNQDSWINQAIKICGGTNVFAHAKLAAPEVSWESVVSANPQVVISDAKNLDWKSRWLKWSGIAAVKNKHLFSIDPDIVERASPRLLQGVEEMCEKIDVARCSLDECSSHPG